ncbi:MAG TPA: hypothetical protein VN923_04615 [Thermoanaerobaculia bacterium]|nr:hypothetical protein [Thermoanaerobaculia bacterium]
MVAAEQRHHMRAVRREGQHRRLGVLVAESRREQADEDAGSADAEDRAAVGEQSRQQDLGVGGVVATAEQLAIEEGAELLGEAGTGGGEGDDGRPHPQASPPR